VSTSVASGQPILELAGVVKRFRQGVEALAGVDLTVSHGEFLSILGPSGCGKSTLLRIVAGLTAPSAGECRLSVDRTPGRIGYVFQDPTLMPWSTVTGNVLLPFRIAGMRGAAVRERALAAVRAVGLGGFEDAYPHQLSGGMRMRVSIARALVTDPDLLLLDEPFAALDEINRLQLNDDLLRLWAERRPTIIFVTHSVFESVYLSTRIAVMTARPGRIAVDRPIDLPQPRVRETRMSAEYGAMCQTMSAHLAEASAR
jgi:NitT/TauT family transport system ATP-binding protein